MDTVALILFFVLVTQFVIRAWKPGGRLAAADRWALISSFGVASAAFAAAALLSNWVHVPTVLWLAAVALLASGTVGAVLRWPELPCLAASHSVARFVSTGATLLVCALLISVHSF